MKSRVKGFSLVLFIGLLFFCGGVHVFASNYYVDSSAGSDSNNGTDSSAPWKSLTMINNRNFVAGDTINFKRGSIWTGNLQIKNSGLASNPITFQAYGTGAAPQIKNPGVSYGHDIDITGSYNIVDGVLLTNAMEAGLFISSSGIYNIIRNSEFTADGTGVMTSGQHNLITANYVHDMVMIINDSAPDTDYGAECFWLQAPNNEVSYNRGVNCKASSIDYGFDGGFLEIWSQADNSNIHHNYSDSNNGFIEFGGNGGSAQNVKISYNAIINNDPLACLHNSGNFAINIANLKIENNTYVNTQNTGIGYRVLDCTSDYSAVQMRNNIFYSDLQISNNGSFTHANNLYNMVSMVNGSGLGYSLGSGEKTGNPSFINLGAKDLHLQSGSPAIDAGLNLGYTLDLDGNSVPAGPAPDMGAYEFSTLPATPLITSPTSATGVVGSAFNYTIAATNNPTSFTAIGLPAGLSINSSTGLISGTPTVSGVSNITLTATNVSGTGNATLVLTLNNNPVSDTLPPSTPTSLSGTPLSSSSLSLSWSSSTDNVGVVGYKVYRNGLQIGTSLTTTYTDTALSPSTAYTYTVSAYDLAGNQSSQSTSVSITTNPASQVFAIGSLIKTSTNLNVRSKAGTNKGSKVICTQPTGASGTITSGPSTNNGLTWWRVNYNTLCDGWSAQNYLSLTTAMIPLTHTLTVGSTGDEVSTLQTILKQLGYFTDDITGYFGSITKAAVIKLQTANALDAVGQVGPNTRELIEQLMPK